MIDSRAIGGITKRTAYTFNSSTTFTTPATMPSNIGFITASAGGGSGAADSLVNTHTTGGDSGQYCIRFPVTLAPSTTYTITIGAGGASPAGAGGNTSFGTLITLTGGKGGRSIRVDGSTTKAQISAYQSQSGGMVSQRHILSFETPPSLLGLTTAIGLNGNKHGENAWDAADEVLATGGAPGLFGDGTNASNVAATSTPAANSGAGSGAVAGGSGAAGAGAAGKLILEIEEFL